MAIKMGMKIEQPEPEEEPELYPQLIPIFMAVNLDRETGRQFSLNASPVDIEILFRSFGLGFDFSEFIRLFRACEKAINERCDSNSNRSKD